MHKHPHIHTYANRYANRYTRTQVHTCTLSHCHTHVCCMHTDDQQKKNRKGNKVYTLQAHRQGGFEGVHSNPPFDLQKILYAPLKVLNCTL